MIYPSDQNIYAPYTKAVNFAIDEVLKSGMNPIDLVLLDAGCGHSMMLEEEYKRCGKIIGVDLDKEGLKLNNLVDQKVLADLTSVPLPDNVANVITCAWVLEHIEKPNEFSREMARLLNVNGRFVAIAPNKKSPISLLIRLVPNRFHQKMVKLIYGRNTTDTFPTFYRLNSEKDLDKAFISAGFTKELVIYNDDPKYFSINKFFSVFANLWYKIVMRKGFEKLRAHIIVVYKKSGN